MKKTIFAAIVFAALSLAGCQMAGDAKKLGELMCKAEKATDAAKTNPSAENLATAQSMLKEAKSLSDELDKKYTSKEDNGRFYYLAGKAQREACK
jgi:uncharacterized protein YigA (DUF484 family)